MILFNMLYTTLNIACNVFFYGENLQKKPFRAANVIIMMRVPLYFIVLSQMQYK